MVFRWLRYALVLFIGGSTIGIVFVDLSVCR